MVLGSQGGLSRRTPLIIIPDRNEDTTFLYVTFSVSPVEYAPFWKNVWQEIAHAPLTHDMTVQAIYSAYCLGSFLSFTKRSVLRAVNLKLF